MGRLINAEFRKILTTKLWWGLMIPAVVLAVLWAWGWSAVTGELINDVTNEPELRNFDVPVDEMSWSVIALARSINIASIFPMIFGALGLASELSRKTITTTFLTAPSRASVLGAKAITYVLWGAIFGLVISAAASLGTLIGSDTNLLPEGEQWFLIVLAGMIMCILWTLVGLGVGALIGSPVGALVILLIYALVVGPFGEVVLFGTTEGSNLPGFLPNGSANGLTGSTAAALLFEQIQTLVFNRGGAAIPASRQETIEEIIRFSAGAPGAFSLWISGLIFLGWTALFFMTGIIRNQRRDIT
ncbi:ABC transporter permease subunit [Actinokineospora iranica]|uniref:ABC-2 type transport system permease protein n=1 Tax=Actinokineospora iranica TaxID=1271860 RepID=A0A1G6W4F5_9PSEU|nr:ABC transporter permease subunit [Actinokineospora iranica]SDD60678.1 ABC-2 type transport system permease protein [Actinokineospora iranica]